MYMYVEYAINKGIRANKRLKQLINTWLWLECLLIFVYYIVETRPAKPSGGQELLAVGIWVFEEADWTTWGFLHCDLTLYRRPCLDFFRSYGQTAPASGRSQKLIGYCFGSLILIIQTVVSLMIDLIRKSGLSETCAEAFPIGQWTKSCSKKLSVLPEYIKQSPSVCLQKHQQIATSSQWTSLRKSAVKVLYNCKNVSLYYLNAVRVKLQRWLFNRSLKSVRD